MWQDMLTVGIPVVEKLIRTAVVYVAILVLLRLFGRRDLAQLTTLDLVVILLLSNVVQNAIIGPDNSLLGGLEGAAILVLLSAFVGRVVGATDLSDRFFEGNPITLVRDGVFVPNELRRLGVRARDVTPVLNAQGASTVDDVERAELMPSGTLVVRLKEDAMPATQADVRQLLTRLDQLEAMLAARPPGPEAARPQS
jgi:uncharacterized membrane protein YcaP (DUF421 family)